MLLSQSPEVLVWFQKHFPPVLPSRRITQTGLIHTITLASPCNVQLCGGSYDFLMVTYSGSALYLNFYWIFPDTPGISLQANLCYIVNKCCRIQLLLIKCYYLILYLLWSVHCSTAGCWFLFCTFSELN